MPASDPSLPCRICGSTTAPKANAHIFPKALFKRAKKTQGDEDFLLAIDRDGSKPPRRVRVGVYDDTILCIPCEARHQDIDTRGIRALFQSPYQAIRVYAKKQLQFKYSDRANARDIRTFLYFILLRAAWSQREVYEFVELAPELEAHLRRTILEGDEPAGFPIPIFLTQHGHATPGFISTPTIYNGLITVFPRPGYMLYQLSVGELCGWIFVGPGATKIGPRTGHLALMDGKRVNILRSPDADAANEDWIAQLIADRMRSGGNRWDRR